MSKIYAGFSMTSIGSATIGWTDSSGTYTADVSTGTYAHVDLQAIMGTGEYDDFATALAAAMNAEASPVTFTVAYSTSSMAYTISAFNPFPGTPVSFNLTTSTNTVMRNILGYNSLPTASATTSTSQIRPYYVIDTNVDAQSAVSGRYEPSGISVDGEADNGDAFGVSREEAPTYFDWTQMMEPIAVVYTSDASASVPWTYEALFKHARNVEPIYYESATYPLTSAVYKLRADGTSWRPQRVTADSDVQWNIPFRCRYLG